MGSGRLYAAVAAGGFRRYATYRAAMLAGIFTNTVFGLILVYTYVALWDERPHLGGYDQAQAITYVWIGQALFKTLGISGGGFEDELMERIRTGDVAVDLYRPADLQLWWLAADGGRALFELFARGVPPFVIGALFFPLALPGDLAAWAAFLVAVALAWVVGFAIRYLVALSAFWLIDGTGVVQMSWFVGWFCSGMMLPLNVFRACSATSCGCCPGRRSSRRRPTSCSARPIRSARTPSRPPGRWRCWRPGGCCSRWRRGGWWSRVADTVRASAVRESAAPGLPGRVREGLRAYGLIAAMWIRSTMAYRASFVLTTFTNFAVTGLDFIAILLMFSSVDALGGFSLPEIAFLYGLSSLAFGLADLLIGSMERLGRRVRDGTLDTLLVRPAPVLAQVAADRFALRRLGRVTQGALVLGYALTTLDIDWTGPKLLLMPVMVVSGGAIFCSVFVAGAAFQFVAQDASEVQNAFTYGGATLLQYPPAVFAQDLVRGVTFVLPLAFVNWLPASYVLGRPYPLDLPRWVAFASPLVAVACCALAGVAWRVGLRSYRSTGS
ncbi:hypothetical protein SUDANB52_05042 [Streptomyces sp. SudanB52_2052]